MESNFGCEQLGISCPKLNSLAEKTSSTGFFPLVARLASFASNPCSSADSRILTLKETVEVGIESDLGHGARAEKEVLKSGELTSHRWLNPPSSPKSQPPSIMAAADLILPFPNER